MTQNEAVVIAVRTVFTEGVVPETKTWTQSQKDEIHSLVFRMFKSGECTKNSGGQTDADLLKYIPGLVNNHVRKDKRLNGGVEYTPKNPGSRSGSGDESIRAMKMLLSVTTETDARAQIQAAIDERLAQLKPKVEINAAALPEALRHLVK
jgi:hypothetical protein